MFYCEQIDSNCEGFPKFRFPCVVPTNTSIRQILHAFTASSAAPTPDFARLASNFTLEISRAANQSLDYTLHITHGK